MSSNLAAPADLPSSPPLYGEISWLPYGLRQPGLSSTGSADEQDRAPDGFEQSLHLTTGQQSFVGTNDQKITIVGTSHGAETRDTRVSDHADLGFDSDGF